MTVPPGTPPMENLLPPSVSLGAPLDTVVILNFSGVPQGPFNQTNLPIFTTPAEVTSLAQAPALPALIPAKGVYLAVGNSVEFHPFLPTAALSVSLSSPPESVPGLLPGSIYTVKVESTAGLKIANLTGAGAEVKFGTTSNPAMFYPTGGTSDMAPGLVSASPVDGTVGFYPNLFSNLPPGASLEAQATFPPGPDSILLTYNTSLLPTESNLHGSDWDSDGIVDPSFFFRMRGTRLLVAHEVPAATFNGTHTSFAALSGLTEGSAVSPTGGDVFLHNSLGGGAYAGPGATAALPSTPIAMSLASDPSLLFAVFDGVVEDELGVVDHVLGDPGHAKIGAAKLAIPGLSSIRGMASLLDGRLIVYDSVVRRLFELRPAVTRDRPTGVPVLTAVTVGDGTAANGFRSAVFPVGLEVLDLAQTPAGDLYAFVTDSGAPALARLNPIDFGVDDVFEASDGLVSSIHTYFVDSYSALEFISETQLLALNRSQDRIDRLSLTGAAPVPVVNGVAGFGTLGPGDPSPALTFALGHVNLDVKVGLEANLAAGAVVRLRPSGVLPPGTTLDVMERVTLASLNGKSAANADPNQPSYVLGAQRRLSVTTAQPQNLLTDCLVQAVDGRITDAVVELFDTTALEDPQPPTLSPKAEWAATVSSGASSTGYLQAANVAAQSSILGDFTPFANTDFFVAAAYSPNFALAKYKFVFLDTDAQSFPLPNGSTPGITQPTTIFGGKFTFRDFIIPEGVWVIVRGSNPLEITATRTLEIAGVLDLSGTNGLGDDTFDTGFTPVPGGVGGPGGGRGGDGHPTLFNPQFVATPDQYVTPVTGGRGLGPVINGATGAVSFQPIGGHGGISTLGFELNAEGFPKLPNLDNSEFSRPPGGGGGSFYFHGMYSHNGSGGFRVQSNNSFGNLNLCPTNNKITDALYGNEENALIGKLPNQPIQCVYLVGTAAAPARLMPGATEGDLVFADGNRANDFIGSTGELAVLIGGQGGGGGGTRVDSMNHGIWSANRLGAPISPIPVHYPTLWFGGQLFFSPTLYDAKGGGGGGGGGSAILRSYGSIQVRRTGRIDASGGNGGGGEVVQNSNFSGAGGGGSGGAVILQAASDIQIAADSTHLTPYFIDVTLAMGAGIDVSGGFGWDARTLPDYLIDLDPPGNEFTRSDGGQGGFGLIQLQEGSLNGEPEVQQGAYLFARQRTVLKHGGWNGYGAPNQQKEHPSWPGSVQNPPPVNELRYIDMLHYREFIYGSTSSRWFLLHGSDPPLINTLPGFTAYQADTPMMDYFGRRVVVDPAPQKMMKTYAGFNPATFAELNGGEGVPGVPGTLFAPTDVIPMTIYLKEPDGTAIKVKDVNGVETAEFDPFHLIDRLPVVPPSSVPPEFGAVSRGTSKWLDFNGVAMRLRNSQGVAPPLFDGMHGTYNALLGVVPPGLDGEVVVSGVVPQVPGTTPAHFVANTGPIPFFDPGLCAQGGGAPFNDIEVDVPEYSLPNAITDNAVVTIFFQGAYPIRAGSAVPDSATVTSWVSDLRALSGYPLIRFQISFDLGANLALFPLDATSKRPAVDSVRLRAKY
ncbi:MAG: hypothetical protein ACT4PU_10890 [Planctomycetota bacterium]